MFYERISTFALKILKIYSKYRELTNFSFLQTFVEAYFEDHVVLKTPDTFNGKASNNTSKYFAKALKKQMENRLNW